MKKLVTLFIVVCVQIFLIACGALVFWWKVPADGTIQTVEYEVREGASLSEIAHDLSKRGALRWPLLFRIYGRLRGDANKIKAGPYTFEPNIVPSEIMQKLVRGEVSLVQFTIPEGWNTWQIAARLASVFPHITKEAWLEEMHAPRYRALLPKEASSLEGYLYPETYSIRTQARADDVLSLMLKTFQKNLSPTTVEAAKVHGLSLHQLVTLASIIEKETRLTDERPHISAVFHNRLRLHMRLQTDPTVIYGIWEHYDGNIRKRDLLTPTPYNTYTIDGLPPGPIASPGREALIAAAEPLPSDDLYFVARENGSHVFSKSLADHNRNVYTYQILPAREHRRIQTK